MASVSPSGRTWSLSDLSAALIKTSVLAWDFWYTYVVHPTSCTLRRAPHVVHPTSCTPRRSPYAVHLTSCTLRRAPYVVHLTPCTSVKYSKGTYCKKIHIYKYIYILEHVHFCLYQELRWGWKSIIIIAVTNLSNLAWFLPSLAASCTLNFPILISVSSF